MFNKNIVLIGLITLLYPSIIKAQERAPIFIGINPSVTVEPFYEKGEMDIGILPLVFQRRISNTIDFRFSTILNLGLRDSGNRMSHLGFETAFPIFFTKKENKTDCSKGFYIAPILSFTRNKIEEHNNLGIWAEPGYNFLFDNKFAMSIGAQFGATYFAYDDGKSKWGNHFGIKFIFGKWF